MRIDNARVGVVFAGACLLAASLTGCLLPFDPGDGADDGDGTGDAPPWPFPWPSVGTAGARCSTDNQCPSSDDPCVRARCFDGGCTEDPVDGYPIDGVDTVGCLRLACRDGDLLQTPDAALADDRNPCTQDLCGPDGTITNDPLPLGTACGTASDAYCDAQAVCQTCPDDGDDCTVEDCSTGVLVIERLDPGDSCGPGAVCSTTGDCFTCDDGNACTTETCDTGERIATPLPAGSTCGEDAYCTAAADCDACEDGDPCTTEECTSGVVVTTGLLPPGSECAAGDVCSPAGECIECDDGNPCTEDVCDGGIVTHPLLPTGTVCEEGPTDGFCDAGVCVTWCLPLPDASCVDVGPGEPANDNFVGAVAYPDDESADFPICGRLATSDVADWYSYPADDDSFRYDTHRLSLWSYGASLRACSFVSCPAGDTEILSCSGAFSSASGPEGEPGCCWEGVFRHEVLVVDVECDGAEDSPLVRMRIDAPGGGACLPYEIKSFSY